MTEQTFKAWTQAFALRAIRLVEVPPRHQTALMIGRQLLRSATSVGAHHRAARRGKSRADVIAKLAVVEEEADESLRWMKLLIKADVVPAARLHDPMREGDGILAMTA